MDGVVSTRSRSELHALFTSSIDQAKFKEALASASEPLWRGSTSKSGISEIFQYGIHILGDVVDFPGEKNGEEVNDNVKLYALPTEEQDITLQTGKSNGIKRENELIESHDITGLMGRRTSGSDPFVGDDEIVPSNGGAGLPHKISIEHLAERLPKEPDTHELNISSIAGSMKSSVSELPIFPKTALGGSIAESFADSIRTESGARVHEINLGPLDAESKNILVGRIATVYRLWFENLWQASKSHNIDAVSIIFSLPGTLNGLTEQHIYDLLERVKYFMDTVLELPPSETQYVSSLKELLSMIHDILGGLYKSVSLEKEYQLSNRFLIVKSLLHAFFKADFSGTFDKLLTNTSPEFSETGDTEEEETEDETAEPTDSEGSKNDIRISYETLMRLYVVIGSLAASPITILLVDKVSLLLDITTLNHMSPNLYANFLRHRDYKLDAVIHQFESRVFPLLISSLNYYHSSRPDLLARSLNHESFFGWVTGHRFTWGLYLNTTTTFGTENKHFNLEDPFVQEVEFYEHTTRSNAVALLGTEDERTMRAPAYLTVTMIMYLLISNDTFVNYLMEPSDDSLLDMWLCLSSYVFHYQHKLKINTWGGRLALLIMLKLTLVKSSAVHVLRQVHIDEYKWKICHHRAPVVPTDTGSGAKTAIMYIVDVVQTALRFNLNKKVDITNCKLSLTILYQMLLEGEAEPFEGLRTYLWRDLHRTLVHFIEFVAKNCNEEDVKSVVEEVFSIFELALSPAFENVFTVSGDLWTSGSHLAKSANYDLLHVMLLHHSRLLELFSKYVIKKDNFKRVEKCLSTLAAEFDLEDAKERDSSEVARKLSELSTVGDEVAAFSGIQMRLFNYAATFKYLDKYNDYDDFDRQAEVIEIFGLLYDTTWVHRKKLK